MSFYVYGRDQRTGETSHRFLSDAATEEEARAEGEKRGLEVTSVVPAAGAASNVMRPHDAHASELTRPADSHSNPGTAHGRPARNDFKHLHASRVPKRAARVNKKADASLASVRVTPALIAVSVLWFAVMAFQGAPANPDALLTWGASYGPMTIGHQWWRLLTASFVHVGVIDLVVHMAVLAYAGWVAERQIGHVALLFVYLIAGIGGNLVAQQTDVLAVVASATAPVAGCVGVLLGLTLWHRGEIDEAVPSACVIIAFAAVFVLAEFGADLSWSALLGGLACGFACGIVLSPSPETDGGARLAWTAAIAALLLCGAGAWAHTKNRGMTGTLAVLDAADELDHRVAAQLQRARLDWQSCRSQPADVASMVQREILADSRALRVRLEQLAPYPPAIATDVAKRLDAMKRREVDLDVPSPSAKWSPAPGSPRQLGAC